MGRENKLLADLAVRPVLAHVLDLATGPAFADTLVVKEHEHARVAALAHERGIRTVHNAQWQDGIGASLRAAAAALDPDLDGLPLLLGDIPLVRSATCRSALRDMSLVRSATLADVVGLWRQRPTPAIVRPAWNGRPGHPVIFANAFVPDLLRLGGDDGAQTVLKHHAGSLVRVDTDDEGTTLDANAPEALAMLRRRVQTP